MGSNNEEMITSSEQQHSEPTPSRLLNGAYIHSVDPKGRVIIPQFFREQISERFVIGVNTAQDAIAIYPFEVWKERIDFLGQLVQKNRSLERVLARFSMLSYPDASYDQQGRVLIPALLRNKFLQNSQSVLVSGAYDYVRIVSQEQAELEDQAFENMDILDLISRSQQEM
jgi:MraZ protein